MFVNDVKEKEPLPQSVEVLSHVAARAATFLVFAVTWTAFKWLRIVPRLALSIFCGPPDRLAFIGQLHIRTHLVTSTLYILLQLESTCLRSHRIPERLWQPFPRSRCTLKYVELALADYHASRAKVQYLCYP